MPHTHHVTRSAALVATGLVVALAFASCEDDCGEEVDFRIIRGVVDASGTIQAGQGFTVGHLATGGYRVAFDAAFATQPVVTVTALWDASDRNAVANLWAPAVDQFDVRISDSDFPASFTDRAFHFIAIGPR